MNRGFSPLLALPPEILAQAWVPKLLNRQEQLGDEFLINCLQWFIQSETTGQEESKENLF